MFENTKKNYNYNFFVFSSNYMINVKDVEFVELLNDQYCIMPKMRQLQLEPELQVNEYP